MTITYADECGDNIYLKSLAVKEERSKLKNDMQTEIDESITTITNQYKEKLDLLDAELIALEETIKSTYSLTIE